MRDFVLFFRYSLFWYSFGRLKAVLLEGLKALHFVIYAGFYVILKLMDELGHGFLLDQSLLTIIWHQFKER